MAQLGVPLQLGGDGFTPYGPPLISGTAVDDEKRRYTPSTALGQRSVSIPATAQGTQPILVSEANASRHILSLSNQGLTTVYMGDTPNVTAGATAGAGANAGYPIAPGGSVTFSPGDYTGPVYAIGSVGAAVCDLRVLELFSTPV